jgi:SAM-dependent methyltransferase
MSCQKAIEIKMDCILCGSKDCQSSPSLVRCNQCGSAFSTSAPPVSYYEDQYSVTQNSIEETEHRRLFRLPEQIRLLRRIKQVAPTANTLLDIGCDKGYFLDEARRHGYEALGIEPSSAARTYCERVGLTVLPKLSLVTMTFDVITMWHSLEHFSDPNETIGAVYKLLNKGGCLFIRVPDYSCLWRKLTGEQWIWYQPRNHYVHYTPDGLKSLLTRHDFHLVTIQSQRPNTFVTDVSFSVASACFGRRTLRKTVGRFYEQLMGVEIFCVAEHSAASESSSTLRDEKLTNEHKETVKAN